MSNKSQTRKALSLFGLILMGLFCAVFSADFSVQQWQAVEITLTSSKTYTDPFQDVDVTATFTGPDNIIITRPAFWDGDLAWKVRFAPTQTGLWTMATIATDATNSGLHNISRTVQCDAYSGNLDIYKHGFLKASSNGRYLTYADGTPFFYLGDTHAFLPHERFDTSNVPGVASQFKYVVDKRVAQGFTVIHSEPLNGDQTGVHEEPIFYLSTGFTSDDLNGLASFDRKFKYIADQGFVHANMAICWKDSPRNHPDVCTDAYMARLAKYWVGRYGAYPVIWSIAQEIDGELNPDWGIGEEAWAWFPVGQSIADNDAYHHPIMPHTNHVGFSPTNPANSWWTTRPYHTGWSVQWALAHKMTDTLYAKSFWNYSPAKPHVMYETTFEGPASGGGGYDENCLIRAYNSLQLGFCGYGYGAYGIWNDLYSKPGEPHDWGCDYLNPEGDWWYDAARSLTADRLFYFNKFYTNLDWWKLVPRFPGSAWFSFNSELITTCWDCAPEANSNWALVSSDSNRTYVVLLFPFEGDTSEAVKLRLHQLSSGNSYKAQWFNPRNGQYTLISDSIHVDSGTYQVPTGPGGGGWLFLMTMNASTQLSGTTADSPLGLSICTWPNPFVSSIGFKYVIPANTNGPVNLGVYDLQGRLVRELVNSSRASGVYNIHWDGIDAKGAAVSNGVYVYRFKTNGRTVAGRIAVLR